MKKEVIELIQKEKIIAIVRGVDANIFCQQQKLFIKVEFI